MFYTQDELLTRLANLEYEILAYDEMIDACDNDHQRFELMIERETLCNLYDFTTVELQESYELEAE